MNDRVRLKIRLYRHEKGFSQKYMAERLNLSQSYYARIENGKTEITVSRLDAISAVLECDPHEFFLPKNVTFKSS